MKQLLIQKIGWENPNAEELSLRFDESDLFFHWIDTVNWAEYPYCPEAAFRIARNEDAILLNFRINESDIKAVCDRDNEKVWEDSCVEFFISFGDDTYYNIECNCIGKLLIGKGAGKEGRIHLSNDLLKRVERWSSLGYVPIDNRSGDWELSLIIPKEVFYPEISDTFDKVKARGNFYKCGDCLSMPHFLSWNPILCETPNFHRPDFFGLLLFE